ncbi:MAG TPA: MATE family efflux transporter [Anaeromyxobacteraceae bacterium]|nr:MATE family efflux transporter [Anaeromyxobacteraceae bacterium]
MRDVPEMEAAGAATAGRAERLRTLLSLAWPIVVSRSSQVVVGVADAVMVAPLGAAALAATTTGGVNAFALFILPMGTVFIVSSFSSQLFGKGDLSGARRYAWCGLAIAAATQLFALATVPFVPALLARLQFAPDLREFMEGYLAVRLLSAGAVVGMEALGNYYGGLGNTRIQMRASVAAMALNVLGNWLLIGGRLGLPALGVRGAAIASTASTFAAFVAMLVVFLGEGGDGEGRIRWDELRGVLRFGLPSGLNWFIEFMAFAFFVNVVVAGLGTTPLAALMTVIQVNSVAFMPAFALASAGAILVGQAIGASRRDAVPGLVGLTFAIAAAWQSAVALAYLAAPGWVLAAFAQEPSSAAEFLAVGRRMLVLSAAWQLFDAGATVLTEALRAAGDTAFTMWARVVVAWAIWAPGSWISVRVLGAGDAVAVGWFVFYLFVLALALLLRFRSGAWRRIALTGP